MGITFKLSLFHKESSLVVHECTLLNPQFHLGSTCNCRYMVKPYNNSQYLTVLKIGGWNTSSYHVVYTRCH